MTMILRSIFFVIFSTLWAVFGLFYWILILCRVVFFVGVELFSALFSQNNAPSISTKIDQVSTVYIDGFKKIYSSCFRENLSTDAPNEITIKSLYELIATLFLMYIFASLLFPSVLIPEINISTSASHDSLQSTEEKSFNWMTFAKGAASIIIFIVALCVLIIIFAENPKVDSSKLLKTLLKKEEFSEEYVREIADSMNVSLPDLRSFIDKYIKEES